MDEMNMYFPRSLKTALEVKRLASVPTQMVTPAKSSSIIGVIQDTLVGCYKATKYVRELNIKEFSNIMATVDTFNGKGINKNKKYTTRDIFSNILPPANYVAINKNTGKKTFDIEEGKLIKGVIGKSQLKPGGGGNMHFIFTTWHDYGMEEATKLINSIQRTINQWLIREGHTLGLGDLVVQNDVVNQKINLLIAEALEEYDKLRRDIADRKITPGIGRTMEDEFEFQTGLIFNNLFGGELPNLIKKEYLEKIESHLYDMVNSGSKGSMINVTQIMGCIGPISIGGKRIPKAYGDRALPHFEKYDDDPISRGFVANNYITGSSPVEFFFQMASGREGSIDTAIKSVTGDTSIVIIENGKPKRVSIGDWIDNKLINANIDDIEYHEEHRQELLNLQDDTFIPTTDSQGNISWGQISAITRHDPGKALYKIKTHSGREVIVTESKSLLVWDGITKEYIKMNTPDVRVGNYVPVTMILEKPSVTAEFIDVKNYLPKDKYLYGTQFHIANNSLPENDRESWWKSNNNNAFTLPYLRVTSLLNIKQQIEIKNNHIYIANLRNKNDTIPDKIIMNRENGFFLGLYLANGDLDIKNGRVHLMNLDSKIQKIVLDWFDQHSIAWMLDHKIVTAKSQLLADFLNNITDNGTNKHVPSETFVASDEFIIGILDGYLSCNSTITRDSIRISCISNELSDNLNMLCSRLGIFVKVTKTDNSQYNLTINGLWIKQLSQKVNLTHQIKNKQMRNIKSIHQYIKIQGNTVMDPIVSIEKISVKLYPKVYDLTVPSTLNFGLANGLHVVDTADSGYISRKLVKSMEDLTIYYDGVVRNSVKRIKQFVYGENGLNPTYCEHIDVDLLKYNNEQLKNKYYFTEKEQKEYIDSDVLTKAFKEKSSKKLIIDEYHRILYYRKLIREYIYMYNSDSDMTFLSPINMTRIIRNTIQKFRINLPEKAQLKKSILDPIYVIKKINGMCKTLPKLYKYNNYNVEDNVPLSNTLDNSLFNGQSEEQLLNDKLDVNKLFEVLNTEKNHFGLAVLLTIIYIKSTLSVKDVFVKYKLTKEAFDYIINQMIFKFSRAIMTPGTAVGAIAAQSIGEPTTQQTLNSVDYEEYILVGRKIGEVKGKLRLKTKRLPIGVFVDKIINQYKNKGCTTTTKYKLFEYNDEAESTYAETQHAKYYVQSCNPKTEQIEWKLIEGISRHIPINEKTDNKEIGKHTLMKITTKSGRTITATRGHSFLIRADGELVRKAGKDLRIGERIPIQLNTPNSDIHLETELDLEEYFPKTEYLWGTEYYKAKTVMEDYDQRGNRKWFSANNGKLFTVPYTRSDTAREAFKTTPRMRKGVQVAQTRQQYQKGCIYPKSCTKTKSVIPEKFKLDHDFGFLIGIYLADGNLDGSRKTKVMITKNDDNVRNKVAAIAKKYGIHTYEQKQDNKNQEGWTSICVILQSVLLSRFIDITCGTLSHNKKIPDFAFNACDDFVKGLLSGYFTGDGCCYITKRIVTASTSKKLIDGLAILLSRLNVHPRIRKKKKVTHNNRGTKPENIHQVYEIYIGCNNVNRLLDNITMIKTYTDDRINLHKQNVSEYTYGVDDFIPGIKISGKNRTIHRDELKRKLATYKKNPKKVQYIKDLIETPVFYDPIKKIEYIEPTNKYTYDLTILDTHTFLCMSTLISNTFHLAGVAAKSQVLSGLPRIKELLRVTKNIQTGMQEIFLEEENVTDKYKAKVIANSVEYTTLRSFTKSVSIYFDPNPRRTIIEEDHEFVKEYFENTIMPINTNKLSRLVIRLELDKHNIIYKQLRMNFIKYRIESYKNGQFYCINSDDNADDLVLHIRLDTTTFGTKTGVEYEQILKAKDIILDDIVIRGIKNINQAQIDNSGEKFIEYDSETGKRNQIDQWIIYTRGTNLKHVLGQPGVNAKRTVSNDVHEVFNILGIEAARQLLYDQFSETYGSSGSVINYHHMGLLVDLMTYYGKLMPISRHGINRTDNSPLTKASFEETLEQLGEASIYGIKDTLTGISANVMCGQTMPSGTGANFDLMYDYHQAGLSVDEIDNIFGREMEIIE